MPDGEFYATGNAVCPLCGAYGLHGCTGVRSGYAYTQQPDWNRLISLVERLVVALEKIAHIDGGEHA